mmetsp:Transcript_133369/g.297567  ORF Transcript_133369/g.297567 Transcript_133369/m.297567 type:complete len:445 (+) Transcript_133369:32-1366(+)
MEKQSMLSILLIPKGLFIFGFSMVLAAVGLIVHHDIRAAKNNAVSLSVYELLVSRNVNVPNPHHVWWTSELFVDNLRVNGFASDYKKARGDWATLCVMDSNRDGISNGQHLGDPCCRWRPSNNYFSLEAHREYRRWHLSHPGEDTSIALKNMNLTLALKDRPADCSREYDADTYKKQFSTFYFYKADFEPEEVGYNVVKIICLLVALAILAQWVIWKELLTDVLPWTTSTKALTWRVRIAISVVSFLYMDLTSGVIHLVLDYAPFDLPGLGILARGFQYHHHDPTAIIRISWFEYASHIHFLVPLIQVAVILSDASRLQRLFWFWGGIWAHLFQTAHRWAHMPPAGLPWIVRAMQTRGLLLSHERHMSHHQDLDSQFTILSGHTDVILDSFSSVVPAARYDLWLLFGVFWFLLPIFTDSICRDAVETLQGTGAMSKLNKVEREV